MFDKFFEKYPGYTIIQKAEENVVNHFKAKLPAQLIDFWKAYGFGVFMNGYLKIVNPSAFQTDLDDAYNNADGEIVIAITAFGDFLTWTGDAVRAIYFKNGHESIIESGDDMEWFFDMDLADEGFLKDNLNDGHFSSAKERLGELEFDECYGYVPLLAMGGREKAENLQRVKLKEHIALIKQAVGKIG